LKKNLQRRSEKRAQAWLDKRRLMSGIYDKLRANGTSGKDCCRESTKSQNRDTGFGKPRKVVGSGKKQGEQKANGIEHGCNPD